MASALVVGALNALIKPWERTDCAGGRPLQARGGRCLRDLASGGGVHPCEHAVLVAIALAGVYGRVSSLWPDYLINAHGDAAGPALAGAIHVCDPVRVSTS